ncbi:MAG TPA: methyltransferase domain-containing protein, partial [Polyangiales bacterium]|nr:methyltransferase domain-containing protein [Polyangiales bacterium]
MYQRRFDTVREDNTHYDLKLGYPSSHSYALDAVRPGASVLDIGSGPLGVASKLVEKGCQVTVVDQHEPEAEPPRAIRVLSQDLNDPLRFDVDVDTVLMLDVIEHLRSPEKFMQDFRAKLDFRPRTVVMTTGNVAFVAQRLMLVLGQFNYGKKGILDRTHTRLFTFRSFEQLAADAGMRIKEVKGVPAPFPLVLGDGVLGKFAVGVNMALIRLSKTLFSYQIYVRAETTPDLDFVLRAAHTHAEDLARNLSPVRS